MLKPMLSPLITTSWPSVLKLSLMLKLDSSKTEPLSLPASKILLIPKLSELKENLTSPKLKMISLLN
jgi:hypothetical protein